MAYDCEKLRCYLVTQSEQNLWASLDQILQIGLNKIDSTRIGKLNRLAKQGFDDLRKKDFEITPKNSDIELLEGLTLSSLGEYRLAHNKMGPRAEDGPLLVVNWRELNFVIDGTHRINNWTSKNSSVTFFCHPDYAEHC